jgi:hypothetical protein
LGITKEIEKPYALTSANNSFPIYRVVKLHIEVLTFKQKKKESLGKACERFNTLLNFGPNLAILDPILIQHFFMGLNRKTIEYLNTASGGSFMHVSPKRREVSS